MSVYGQDNGTEIARTEVTQYLIQYIKDNKLQFAGNAKVIKPDKTKTHQRTVFNK